LKPKELEMEMDQNINNKYKKGNRLIT
jgi:hypothetical protein